MNVLCTYTQPHGVSLRVNVTHEMTEAEVLRLGFLLAASMPWVASQKVRCAAPKKLSLPHNMGIDVQVLTKKQRTQIESKVAAENIQPASVLGKTWSGPNDSTPQVVLHRAAVDIITDQTLNMRDVEICQEGGVDWVVQA